MPDTSVVQALVDSLEQQKPNFLSNVRVNVSNYIRNAGSDCLTVVERSSDGSVASTWRPGANTNYARRLVAFCRGVKHDGKVLDSALTDPTVAVVTREFEKLYESQHEVFATAMAGDLVRDEVFARGLIDSVVQSKSIALITDGARQLAAKQLLVQLQAGFHTLVTSSIGKTVGHSVAAAVATPVGQKIALLLVKALSIHMKAIILKMLSSVAVKKAIMLYAKKFIAAAVLAGVAKAIAVKLGISAGGAVMLILLPVLAAYLIYEVTTFPKQLGEKVAERVVQELDASYRSLNTEIAQSMADAVLTVGLGALASQLAQDSELSIAIADFAMSQFGDSASAVVLA